MGRKDLSGKDFFADRKRFAELLNVILYQGKRVIRAEELILVHRKYPSLFGKGEVSRDVFMKDTKRSVCYGLELETESDYSMPERIMVYDACEFEHQIKEIGKEHEEEEHKKKQQGKRKLNYQEKKSRMKETDFLLPVVTAVLYLGIDHWQGRQKLSELYRFSGKNHSVVDECLPDYGFPLAEADFVNADAFETDLKEFFQAMQCRKDKGKLRELLKMESFHQLKEDAVWAIAVHLDRERLAAKVEKEGLDVCVALDELLEDERREGIKEGIKEGRIEGEKIGKKAGKKEERISIIRNMVHEGINHKTIRKVTGCSLKELKSIAEG